MKDPKETLIKTIETYSEKEQTKLPKDILEYLQKGGTIKQVPAEEYELNERIR